MTCFKDIQIGHKLMTENFLLRHVHIQVKLQHPDNYRDTVSYTKKVTGFIAKYSVS